MSLMMKDSRRKCLICGRSPTTDPETLLHRFPKPGLRNTFKCESWAKFCFPEREWYSREFHKKLNSEHKMLCNRHFKATSFIDWPDSAKNLHRHAIPEVICEEDYAQLSKAKTAQPPLTGEIADNTLLSLSQGQKSSTSEHNSAAASSSSSSLKCHKETMVPSIDDPLIISVKTNDPTLVPEDDMISLNAFPSSWEVDPPSEASQLLVKTELDPVEIVDDQSVPSCGSSCHSGGFDISKAAHEGLCCNVCLEPIVGFRYVCVECPDYDLCAACEARSAHPAHYVLRVPGPRPYLELKAVLEAIRRYIAETLDKKPIVDCEPANEIKSEPEEEVVAESEMVSQENVPECEMKSHAKIKNQVELTLYSEEEYLDESLLEPDETSSAELGQEQKSDAYKHSDDDIVMSCGESSTSQHHTESKKKVIARYIEILPQQPAVDSESTDPLADHESGTMRNRSPDQKSSSPRQSIIPRERAKSKIVHQSIHGKTIESNPFAHNDIAHSRQDGRCPRPRILRCSRKSSSSLLVNKDKEKQQNLVKKLTSEDTGAMTVRVLLSRPANIENKVLDKR